MLDFVKAPSDIQNQDQWRQIFYGEGLPGGIGRNVPPDTRGKGGVAAADCGGEGLPEEPTEHGGHIWPLSHLSTFRVHPVHCATLRDVMCPIRCSPGFPPDPGGVVPPLPLPLRMSNKSKGIRFIAGLF